MDTLGQRVKFLREQKNMSQSDVANATGISRSNIGKIENNKINPNCDAIIAIAKLFNVTTDFLLLGQSNGINNASIDINTDTSELSKEETDLILAFRHFDELDKELVKNTVASLLKRLEKRLMSYSYVPGDEEAATLEIQPKPIDKCPISFSYTQKHEDADELMIAENRAEYTTKKRA